MGVVVLSQGKVGDRSSNWGVEENIYQGSNIGRRRLGSSVELGNNLRTITGLERAPDHVNKIRRSRERSRRLGECLGCR